MIKEYYFDGEKYHYRMAIKPVYIWELSDFADWLYDMPECKLTINNGYIIAEFVNERFYHMF